MQYFLLIFIPMVAFELLYSKYKKLELYDMRETLLSLAMYLTGKLMLALDIFSEKNWAKWLYDHRLFELNLPLWLMVLVTFLVMDLIYYVGHRIAHETSWGWASHIVHHAPKKMNFTMGVRDPLPVIRVISLFTLVLYFPGLLGIPLKYMLPAFAILLAGQTFIHTRVLPRLGWIDYVFNTPSNHRMHHGLNPECINKNYGGVFMIYDHLFGTYAKEDPGIQIRYGVTNPPEKKYVLEDAAFRLESAFREPPEKSREALARGAFLKA